MKTFSPFPPQFSNSSRIAMTKTFAKEKYYDFGKAGFNEDDFGKSDFTEAGLIDEMEYIKDLNNGCFNEDTGELYEEAVYEKAVYEEAVYVQEVCTEDTGELDVCEEEQVYDDSGGQEQDFGGHEQDFGGHEQDFGGQEQEFVGQEGSSSDKSRSSSNKSRTAATSTSTMRSMATWSTAVTRTPASTTSRTRRRRLSRGGGARRGEVKRCCVF
jgi:hypothetical protein